VEKQNNDSVIFETIIKRLKKVGITLDNYLGDTDPDTLGMTDEEIREEEPIFWACMEIFSLINQINKYRQNHNRIWFEEEVMKKKKPKCITNICYQCGEEVYNIPIIKKKIVIDDGADLIYYELIKGE